jgi:hypothetical protein
MPKPLKNSHTATVKFDKNKVKLLLGRGGNVEAIAFTQEEVPGDPETITYQEFIQKDYVLEHTVVKREDQTSGDVFCVKVGGEWICLE